MEILHTINLIKANVPLENVELDDIQKRNSYVLKTPTTTFPFLETEKGNISESRGIQYFLCNKYMPKLLGESPMERAKVNQWMEFAGCEIYHCLQNIVYPLFGWKKYNKELADKANNKLKDYLKIIENNLKSNEYICGKEMSSTAIVPNSIKFAKFAISENGNIWDVCNECREDLDVWIKDRKEQLSQKRGG